MAWLVDLFKNGAAMAPPSSFERADEAVRAGNSAIRECVADDVTVRSREAPGVYYQFSTVRTASEEQRIVASLQAEVDGIVPSGVQ